MMDLEEPILELHRICLGDPENPVLLEVTVAVHPREVLGLVFATGKGKSALLRIGAGLLRPDAGEVVYKGRNLYTNPPPEPPRFGFVFGGGGLLENTSVFENVALPLRYHEDLDEAAVEERVTVALDRVGLLDDAFRFPWQITRDRARLASLARALVRTPEVVFVDEHFVGADAATFHLFEEVLGEARDRHGTSSLLVLDATPADFGVCDKLLLIDHGAVLETARM